MAGPPLRAREENVLADALTNEDYSAFKDHLRIEAHFGELQFEVLHKFVGRYQELAGTLVNLKAASRDGAPGGAKRPRAQQAGLAGGPRSGPRVAKRNKLRARAPW